MNPIVIRVLNILLAIACVVLCYLLSIWVLGLLGVVVPEQILKVVFVIIGLLAAIWALSGRLDNWWKSGP